MDTRHASFRRRLSNQGRPIRLVLLRGGYLHSPLGTRGLHRCRVPPPENRLRISTFMIRESWPEFKGLLSTIISAVLSGVSEPCEKLFICVCLVLTEDETRS